MTEPHELEVSAIRKLEKVVDELAKRHVWSDEEVDAIKAMIKMWRGFLALGIVFGATKQILIWIGVFAGALIAFRAGVLDWLGIPK